MQKWTKSYSCSSAHFGGQLAAAQVTATALRANTRKSRLTFPALAISPFSTSLSAPFTTWVWSHVSFTHAQYKSYTIFDVSFVITIQKKGMCIITG